MTLYEKRGRRYVPVRDTDAYEGLGNGTWLVTIQDGFRSTRTLVEPDRAGFLAAAVECREAMIDALRAATAPEPRERVLTARERKAFEAWKAIMGDDVMWLQRKSAGEIVEAGIEAVRKQEKGRK